MRTKEKIMEHAHEACNFDTIEQMQMYLLLELLCDLRDDQIAHNNEMERLMNLRLGM